MVCSPVTCTPGNFQTLQVVSVQEQNSVIKLLTPTCLSCPRGYYQNKQGQAICSQCPPGYTTLTVGSQSSEDCHKQCNLGYYSLDGFEPCLKCPNGTSTILQGSSVCSNCTDIDYINGSFCDPSKCKHYYNYYLLCHFSLLVPQ